jgi:hypothetical protein
MSAIKTVTVNLRFSPGGTLIVVWCGGLVGMVKDISLMSDAVTVPVMLVIVADSRKESENAAGFAELPPEREMVTLASPLLSGADCVKPPQAAAVIAAIKKRNANRKKRTRIKKTPPF